MPEPSGGFRDGHFRVRHCGSSCDNPSCLLPRQARCRARPAGAAGLPSRRRPRLGHASAIGCTTLRLRPPRQARGALAPALRLTDLSRDKSVRACLPPAGALPRPPSQARTDWQASRKRRTALPARSRAPAIGSRKRSTGAFPVDPLAQSPAIGAVCDRLRRKPAEHPMTDLSGLWTLTDDRAEHAVPFAIPGDGITALHAAGVIPDPYWGRNEYASRWIADRDWTATRSFPHDGTPVRPDRRPPRHRGRDPAERHPRPVRRQQLPPLPRDAPKACARARTRSPSPSAPPPAPPMRHRRPSPSACPMPPATARSRTATCCASRNATSAGTGTSRWRPSASTGAIALEPEGDRIDDILVTQDHAADRATVVRCTVHADAEDVAATVCDRRHKALGASKRRRTADASPSTTPTSGGPHGLGPQTLHTLTVTAGERASPPAASACATCASSPSPTRPGAASPSTSTATPSSRAAPTGSPPTRCPGRITPEKTRALLQSAVDGNHEHDPRLGRRPLRAGLVLRALRRAGPDGLAGLHVLLPSLPLDRRIPRRGRAEVRDVGRAASATTPASRSGAATTNSSAR